MFYPLQAGFCLLCRRRMRIGIVGSPGSYGVSRLIMAGYPMINIDPDQPAEDYIAISRVRYRGSRHRYPANDVTSRNTREYTPLMKCFVDGMRKTLEYVQKFVFGNYALRRAHRRAEHESPGPNPVPSLNSSPTSVQSNDIRDNSTSDPIRRGEC